MACKKAEVQPPALPMVIKHSAGSPLALRFRVQYKLPQGVLTFVVIPANSIGLTDSIQLFCMLLSINFKHLALGIFPFIQKINYNIMCIV